MSDRLFTPASREDWHKNAIVGGSYSEPYVFMEGFYEAAYMLISSALEDVNSTRDLTFLFHPICFLYRHYIELSLKYLIQKSELLYAILDELGYSKGILQEYRKDKLTSKHQLKTLLDWLSERIKFTLGKPLPKELIDVIEQFGGMDPDGQNFRYSIRTDGQQGMPQQFGANIEVIQRQMESAHSILSGLNDWLEEEILSSGELLDIFRQEYGQRNEDSYY
jgi:hypothetical protein